MKSPRLICVNEFKTMNYNELMEVQCELSKYIALSKDSKPVEEKTEGRPKVTLCQEGPPKLDRMAERVVGGPEEPGTLHVAINCEHGVESNLENLSVLDINAQQTES